MLIFFVRQIVERVVKVTGPARPALLPPENVGHGGPEGVIIDLCSMRRAAHAGFFRKRILDPEHDIILLILRQIVDLKMAETKKEIVFAVLLPRALDRDDGVVAFELPVSLDVHSGKAWI